MYVQHLHPQMPLGHGKYHQLTLCLTKSGFPTLLLLMPLSQVLQYQQRIALLKPMILVSTFRIAY